MRVQIVLHEAAEDSGTRRSLLPLPIIGFVVRASSGTLNRTFSLVAQAAGIRG
jgi:hypothetical protein